MAPPPGSVNAAPPTVPMRWAGTPASDAASQNRSGSRGLDHVARLILAEQPGMRRQCRAASDRGSRRDPPAIAISASATSSPPSDNVVAGSDQAAVRSGRGRNRRCGARRRDRPAAAGHPRCPRSRADTARRRDGPRVSPIRISALPSRFSARSTARRGIVDQPDAADHRGRPGSHCRSSRCRATHCRRRPGSRAPDTPRACLRSRRRTRP